MIQTDGGIAQMGSARKAGIARARGRIWVVSELYYPEQTSTGYFVTRIAETLAEQFEVTALCSQPTYSSKGVRAPQRERRNGVAIRRARSTRFPKDRVLGRLVNVATFSIATFGVAVRRLRHGDVVLVVTNPPLLPYVLLLAARTRGARVVLLVHDVYPDLLVAIGVAPEKSAVVRIWHRASRMLYSNVERIVVLGRDMAARIGSKVADPRKVVIIPNWGDVERVRPSADAGQAIRKELGLVGKIVIQFMGNMGRSHAMDALIRAARELRTDDRFHFVLMGWGAQRAGIEATIRHERLTNMSVLAPCSEEELGAHLNACDLAVIPFVPGMSGISVPSRMYNVLAAGKPLIAVADADSEVARLTVEEAVGWVVPADQPEQLARCIVAVSQQPEVLRETGARARRLAEERFTQAVVCGRYLSLFERLVEIDPAGAGGKTPHF